MRVEVDSTLSRFWGRRFGPITTVKLKCVAPGLEDIFQTDCQVRRRHDRADLTWSSGQSFNGKLASTSALAEGLERLGTTSSPFRQALIRGSYDSLRQQYNLLALAHYHLFSTTQFADVEEGATWSRFANLGPGDVVDWLAGRHYKSEMTEEVLFPFARLTLDHGESPAYDWPTTSGVAIGSDYEMAFSNALKEFLERDAFLRHWWHRRAPSCYLAEDLREISLGPVSEVVRTIGNRLAILDLSDVWGIPIFISMIWGRADRGEPALIVSGNCDLDPRKTLAKSIIESARIFSSFSHVMAKREVALTMKADQLEDFTDIMNYYSVPENAARAKFLIQGNRPGSKVLQETLARPILPKAALLAKVSERNASVLAFDLTPADLAQSGLYVVRVILPQGLPLNCAHRLRPLGCPYFKSYNETDLNHDPHPFA